MFVCEWEANVGGLREMWVQGDIYKCAMNND